MHVNQEIWEKYKRGERPDDAGEEAELWIRELGSSYSTAMSEVSYYKRQTEDLEDRLSEIQDNIDLLADRKAKNKINDLMRGITPQDLQTLRNEKTQAETDRDARPDTTLTLAEIEALQAQADISLIRDSISIQSIIDKFNSDLKLEINFDSGDKISDKLEKIFKKIEELLKNPDDSNELIELREELRVAKKTISELEGQLAGREKLEEIIEIDLNILDKSLPGKIEDKKKQQFRQFNSYQQLSVARQELIKENEEQNLQQYSKKYKQLVNQRTALSFSLITSLLVIGSLIYKINSQKKTLVLEESHKKANRKVTKNHKKKTVKI